jgi:fluoroacetyl-CoA thioesterase
VRAGACDSLAAVKDSLRPGVRHAFSYRVPVHKTVPALYPEAPEFQAMPAVFATGFLVGLVEWTCIQALTPHLEPGEQSLGIRVDLSHEAPTPPGETVTVEVSVQEVAGRRVVFDVEARDPSALVCRGRHERAVIDGERFARRLAERKGGA